MRLLLLLSCASTGVELVVGLMWWWWCKYFRVEFCLFCVDVFTVACSDRFFFWFRLLLWGNSVALQVRTWGTQTLFPVEGRITFSLFVTTTINLIWIHLRRSKRLANNFILGDTGQGERARNTTKYRKNTSSLYCKTDRERGERGMRERRETERAR